MSDEVTRLDWTEGHMESDIMGKYMLYADHRRIVEGLEAKIKEHCQFAFDSGVAFAKVCVERDAAEAKLAQVEQQASWYSGEHIEVVIPSASIGYHFNVPKPLADRLATLHAECSQRGCQRERYVNQIGRCAKHADEQLAKLAALEAFFLSWILRAYESRKRQGWEDGMTEQELDAALLDILFNYGADPGLEQHREAVNRLRAMPPARKAPHD